MPEPAAGNRAIEPDTRGVEHVSCCLCGSEESEVHCVAEVRPHRRGVFAKDRWEVLRCVGCGLIYVSPRIDEAARNALYEFRSDVERERIRAWFFENADLQRPLWRRFLRVLEPYCAEGKVLDVGCGSGGFLLECTRQGYEAAGQEIAPLFVEHCRGQGLTIHDGFLEDLDLSPGGFDVVTAFDVIEHHPDPKQLIRQMRSLLRPDGIAMLSTHDIGNFFARLYGTRWRYLNPTSHITFFDRKSMTRLLEENGFRVERIAGIHSIDATRRAEIANFVSMFWRVVVLRGLVIALYRPLARLLPWLTRWKLRLPAGTLDHDKLLKRAGTQIAMNDDLVVVARAV